MKNDINTKIKEITNYFGQFKSYTNKIIVLGTIDYMKLSLRESNLNSDDEYVLLIFIQRYLNLIENIQNNISSEEEFIYMDLDYLEEIFDQFQEFVSA